MRTTQCGGVVCNDDDEDEESKALTIARRVSLLLGENEGVELLASVQGVKVLRLIQAPEHGGSVLAT